MRIRNFEFSLRELAGSMGDFGTLLPLAIGYIVVNDMNPAGIVILLRNSRYLLSGLARCGYCDKALVGQDAKRLLDDVV